MKRTAVRPDAHATAAQSVDAAIAKLKVKPDIYGFTVDDAGQILEVSRREVYYFIKIGELGVVRHPSRSGNGPGGKRRIPRTAIIDYVARRLTEAEAHAAGG